MAAKAYVLIEVTQGKVAQVVTMLQGKPGVTSVEPLEGPPDVLMVTGAAERGELAKLTIDALLSIECLTEDIRILPVSDGDNICKRRAKVRGGEYEESVSYGSCWGTR